MEYDENTLMTEVVKYTRRADGRPITVAVPYVQVGEGSPGAIQLGHTPEGTWWAPSGPDVDPSQELKPEEYAQALEDWQAGQQAREAQKREAEQLAQEERALSRARAREELKGLGLSQETIQVLMAGGEVL